jgi:hypothetical protein
LYGPRFLAACDSHNFADRVADYVDRALSPRGPPGDTVGRIAAEGTAEFIEADYRFAPLPGVGHYAADQQPARISELLLDHLTRHPV